MNCISAKLLAALVAVSFVICTSAAYALDVSVDGKTYRVADDGGVISADGTAVDADTASKAQYTATVARERITGSKYNQVAFAPVTRTMIELISLVKPVTGAYAYILFSSTDLATATVEGGVVGGPAGALGNVLKDVSKDTILEITKELVEHPEKAAMKIANDAYAVGLTAYRDNYRLYKDVTENAHVLTYDEAVSFMANEKQKEILGVATKLIRDIRSDKYDLDVADVAGKAMEKVAKTVADLEKEGLGDVVEWSVFASKFKPIFDEAGAGLESYEPFKTFTESMASLDEAFDDMEGAFRQNITYADFSSNDAAQQRWEESKVQPPADGPAYASDSSTPSAPVDAEYRSANRNEVKEIMDMYGSIPGGIVLEGAGAGIPACKHIKYYPQLNAFILDGRFGYVSPVTKEEMRDILRSVSDRDKLGISLSYRPIIYGSIPESSPVVVYSLIADNFLGHIAYAYTSSDWLSGYRTANGYEPKVEKCKDTYSGVTFRFGGYEFGLNGRTIQCKQSTFTTLMVPLRRDEKGSDGGHLPDYDNLAKDSLSDEHLANVEHLTKNFRYERGRDSWWCYGQAI